MTAAVTAVRYSHGKQETDEEFDNRYVKYFDRPEIDHWEIRKAMNDLTVLSVPLYMLLCVVKQHLMNWHPQWLIL